MTKYAYLILLLTTFTTPIFAQTFESDSLAKQASITLERNLGEITLYDYGQTTMKMKFYKYELPYGNLYGSLVSLSTPNSKYNIYTDPATTVRLSLDETEEFINKLDALLKIDSIKDTKLNRNITISSVKELSSGTTVWRTKKTYSFAIVTENGELIRFSLKTNNTGDDIDESDIEGILLTDDSEVNYFTVNDYNEYRKRVKNALIQFDSVLRGVRNDKNRIKDEKKVGLYTENLDFTPLIDKGYKVLKSNINNTENVQLVSDVTLKRTPRKIKISDYNGQFANWVLVSDNQLNIYAKEIINYESFIDDLIPLLEKHNAKGIINPEVTRSEDTIIANFTIFR